MQVRFYCGAVLDFRWSVHRDGQDKRCSGLDYVRVRVLFSEDIMFSEE